MYYSKFQNSTSPLSSAVRHSLWLGLEYDRCHNSFSDAQAAPSTQLHNIFFSFNTYICLYLIRLNEKRCLEYSEDPEIYYQKHI